MCCNTDRNFRFAALPPNSPLRRVKQELLVLHYPALTAGGLVAMAELRSLGRGHEGRARSIGYSASLRIGARDDSRLRAEHARVFALQRPIGVLGIGFARL